MTPEDESGDELSSAYRRDRDASGSPSAATRAAILAEARAAALRRTPAANDSRHVWRAVAGIAVLGVALLLWRQTGRHVTTDLTVATDRPAAAAGPEVTQQAAATAPADAAREPAAPAKDARSASPKADAAEREADSGRADNASTTAADSQRLASVNAAPSAAPSAAPAAAGAMRSEGIDYQQLLQREFPEVWNDSEPPHTVWVVIDAQGHVLRKGSLSPGAAITPDQPFETQRPWTMIKVQTASGRMLQLAVMTLN